VCGSVVLTLGLGSFEAWAVFQQRNTSKQLPKPEALPAPTPSPTLHESGFMQYSYIKPRRSVIAAGQGLSFDIHIANGGSFPAHKATTYQWIPIRGSSSEERRKVLQEFSSLVAAKRKEYLSGGLTGADVSRGSDSWVTLGNIITDKQSDGLMDGSLTQYVLWWSMWEDPLVADPSAQGCMWLQKPEGADLSKEELFWHYCTEAPISVTPPAPKPSPFPSIAFLYRDHSIQVHNLSDDEVTFWGTKLDVGPRSMEGAVVTIPKAPFYYYIHSETFEQEVLSKFTDGQVRLVPFYVYLKDSQMREFTVKCGLRTTLSNKAITVETQGLGSRPGWLEWVDKP
jgi:hypothetical protein